MGGACGMDCGRLATAERAERERRCAWDETHRHCGWAAPACAASSGAPEHCDASAFCQYDAGARACDATYACEDLGDGVVREERGAAVRVERGGGRVRIRRRRVRGSEAVRDDQAAAGLRRAPRVRLLAERRGVRVAERRRGG